MPLIGSREGYSACKNFLQLSEIFLRKVLGMWPKWLWPWKNSTPCLKWHIFCWLERLGLTFTHTPEEWLAVQFLTGCSIEIMYTAGTVESLYGCFVASSFVVTLLWMHFTVNTLRFDNEAEVRWQRAKITLGNLNVVQFAVFDHGVKLYKPVVSGWVAGLSDNVVFVFNVFPFMILIAD